MWLTVKIILANLAISCLLCQNVQSQETQPLSLSPSELQTLLNFIYAPNDELFALQRAALRQQLHNLLEQQEQERLEQEPADDYYYPEPDKRSITSLARGNGVLLKNGKRDWAEMKRSLASLAKTGQLPSKEPDAEDGQLDSDSWQEHDTKRSLGALARSGNLLQSGGKRSLASLRKNDMMPYALKRSLAALARENMLPGKRNIGSMARDYALPNQKTRVVDSKRNLGALKNSPVHGKRKKRQIPASDVDDSYLDEASPLDYDELLTALENNVYPPPPPMHSAEKRFLGSLARGGGFRSSGYYPSVPAKRHVGALARWGMFHRPMNSRGLYRASPQKRHIGALARSGWLSSFRPVRSGRFSRSERRSQIPVDQLSSIRSIHRTTISPDHTTDSNYLSPASVGGARQSTRAVGPPPVFITGASRLDSPLSSGVTYAIPTEYFNSLLPLIPEDHDERDVEEEEQFKEKPREEEEDYSLYDEGVWDVQNHL